MEENSNENVIINDENQQKPLDNSDFNNSLSNSNLLLNNETPLNINNNVEKEKLNTNFIIPNTSSNSNPENLISNNINNNDVQNKYMLKDILENNSKNVSKEEKMEQIKTMLHSLLSELAQIKEKGNQLFASDDFSGAEQLYREGIQKINEFPLIGDLDGASEEIQVNLYQVTNFNKQFYNNLASSLFKQGKFEESLKNSELIIQQFDPNHLPSYGRILFCLIELKKIILANHYADIIKKQFGKTEHMSKFKDQLDKLELLNIEYSNKILEENPEIKNEIISLNDDFIQKNEEENKKLNNFIGYLPYILGGGLALYFGGKYIHNKLKK